ncbi:MAG: hypothetical protein GXO69_08625 [Acidobacteria bacterium]|nr:hypothetical protein [Acidobacteriota bacterium]
MDIEKLKTAVTGFSNMKVLVAGDIVLDEFMYTEIDRVSREAPVFICRYEHSERFPGCAGNTAMNVLSLGAKPFPAGIVGRDEDGSHIFDRFWNSGMDLRCLQKSRRVHTMKKTRILAGGVHRAKQHMLRVDRESEIHRFQLLRMARSVLDDVDAVIISDYGYNTVTPFNTERLIPEAMERGIPVFVDSRYRVTAFKHAAAITPNEEEAAAALGKPIPENGKELLDALETLARWADCHMVLLTRGSKGMVIHQNGDRSYTAFPIYGSPEPVDVSGAGDSVMAAFALAAAYRLSPEEAAVLATISGGISVMKKGTYAVTQTELQEALNAENLPKGTTFSFA